MPTNSDSSFQRASKPASSCLGFALGLRQLIEPLPMIGAGAVLAVEDADGHGQLVDAAAAILQGRRHGRVPDRHARRGRIEQADGLVGQLAAGDVAVRKPHGVDHRLVEDPHLVVLLQRVDQAAHHVHARGFRRLFDLDDLEAAGQGGVLLEVLLVFGPGGGGDGAQLAAGQGRLEQIGGVALPGLPAGADHRVGLVDEEDDRLGRGFHFLDDGLQPVLELALDARPGLQQAQVERAEHDVPQRRRHVAGGDPQGEALDHGGLAHARLAGQDRIVLAAAGEDVDDLADFGVASEDGIDVAAAGPRGQVDGELIERGRFGRSQRACGTPFRPSPCRCRLGRQLAPRLGRVGRQVA